jgi:hypothetical protein
MDSIYLKDYTTKDLKEMEADENFFEKMKKVNILRNAVARRKIKKS